jgi:hypothetical protein
MQSCHGRLLPPARWHMAEPQLAGTPRRAIRTATAARAGGCLQAPSPTGITRPGTPGGVCRRPGAAPRHQMPEGSLARCSLSESGLLPGALLWRVRAATAGDSCRGTAGEAGGPTPAQPPDTALTWPPQFTCDAASPNPPAASSRPAGSRRWIDSGHCLGTLQRTEGDIAPHVKKEPRAGGSSSYGARYE